MLYLQLTPDTKMPYLGLGTWQASDAELETALESALEIGYRHFDTATLYENELTIGRVLSRWLSSGRIVRSDLFITTKLPPMGLYADRVEKYLKESLDDLKLDYIDLYLIHSPDGIKSVSGNAESNEAKEIEMDTDVNHVAVWQELEKHVDEGRIKAIGLSNFSTCQIENILVKCRINPVVLQIELHVYNQQDELVEFCKNHQISVVAYSPLGSPGLKDFYAAYGKTKEIPNLLQNSVVRRIAQKYNKTAAQILLRHTVQRGIAAIPKSTNYLRLKENFDVFDFDLSDEDMANLKALNMGDLGQITHWESWTWI